MRIFYDGYIYGAQAAGGVNRYFVNETLDVKGLFAEAQRRAFHGADALICISEKTRDDLLERYPALADRVHVTHLAASIDASISHGPEPVPPRPYFLHVGFRAGYKNFDLLLAAFARVAPACPDAVLCVVGAPLTDEEERRVVELGLAGRLELFEHPTDAHLAKLYDPRSVDELADILLMMLDSPSERGRLIERGVRRAQQFSWDATVAQTLEIYRSVAACGGASLRRTLKKS